MPSSKKSSWSTKSLRVAALALAALLVPVACIAVDETKGALDIPLGPDYLPLVTRDPAVWPRKVLILPVSGFVKDETRAEFEREFLAALRPRVPWNIVLYDGADSTTPDLQVSEEAALTRARTIGAGSILQINLDSEEIYAPLRLTAEIRMQSVADGHTFYRLDADYDARNKIVANSARRFYQKDIQNRGVPDKSESILHNRPDFLRFTGTYTGQLVGNSFTVPTSQTVSKAQAVTSSVPAPATEFQENPIQTGKDK
jgi:hypothetical protein